MKKFILLLIALTGCTYHKELYYAPENVASTKSDDQQGKIMKSITNKEHKTYNYKIKKKTYYYLIGPQQALPPDGTFDVNTKIAILDKSSGSYVLVESENGIKAYVALNDIIIN